jgi:hypothetical protein
MEPELLIAEGLRLSRPSLILSESPAGQPLAGIWGGPGIAPSPPGAWKHWVSVDCSWLANRGFPLGGCLSVYEDDHGRFAAVASNAVRLPLEGIEGIPLFGREELSMPPCEALDVCGSDLARRWFEAGGGRDVALAYDAEYQRRCPLFRDGVDAVLGGWHAFWPDADRYDDRPGRLVLWTFRDAEPWVEVWLDQMGRLTAIRRIT